MTETPPIMHDLKRPFPIMHDYRRQRFAETPLRKSIPWAMIESHRTQAGANHYQSLERLAERGGLCPAEAIAVLKDRRFEVMNEIEAENFLEVLVTEWENWESGR